jgi:transposase-like protein
MQTAEKRRRRRFTQAFKAAAIALGSKPGASVAATV